MRRVVFAPEARDEFEATAEWYQAASPGLGEEFVERIDGLVRRIAESPSEPPRWEHDDRFRKVVASAGRTRGSHLTSYPFGQPRP